MARKLLSIVLVLTAVLALAGPLSVSADFENTYTNTGDMRADLIGVALTQVGYEEGPNNDTKYGDWMNLSNHPWCGIFVSWCARQAGIPTSVLKNTGIANPANFGLSYYTIDEYTPRAGDLFFKKNFSHVGIVYSVGSTTFTTIEGNTGGDGYAVLMQTRTLSEYYFASPNYPTDSHHNYEKHYEDKHPHKEYYQCTDCSSSYYTGNNVYVDSCTTCIQENCTHSYGDWSSSGSDKHSRTCSKCGKQETESHSWKTDQVTKEATCKQTGSQEQTCTVCKAQRTDTIPKTDDHDYGDWEYLSDDFHQRVCAFCGGKETKKHDVPEDTQVDVDEESPWSTDEKEHWLECGTCAERVRQAEHDFGEDCVAPCAVCAYVREEGHFYGDILVYSDTEHWRQCSVCAEESGRQAHVFTAECDETCEHCDYVRQVEHSFSKELLSNGESHWYECTVCGQTTEAEAHLPGPEATEDAPQICTLCGWELAEKIAHVHDYQMEYDEVSHFGTCRCGQTIGPESHMWDMTTGNCHLCGKAVPVQQTQERSWEFVWYIAGGVLVAATATVITVLCVNRKRRMQV